MSNQASIQSLFQSIAQTSPELYTGLNLLLGDLYTLYGIQFPSTGSGKKTGGVSSVLTDITGFSIATFPNNVRLTWNLLPSAAQYEIRVGASWELGIPILTTSSNQANLDPISDHFVTGPYLFWIKGLDSSGLYSPDAVSVALTVPAISAPSLSGVIIANNVLLSWSIPSSLWKIDHYKLFKGGVEIAQTSSNFKDQVELVAGTYSYTIVAFDIVGNSSAASQAFVAAVNSPIDFSQLGNVNSTYGGAVTDTAISFIAGVKGILGAVPIESWSTHFSSRSWTNIQDQINAGYPLFFQPSGTTGTYVEVFDFGTLLSNVNVSCIFNKTNLNGTSNVSVSLELSTDNITYGSPISSASTFAVSVRYVRATLTFTNADDKSAAFVSGLKMVADVQFTIDSGVATSLSTDALGTEVNYNFVYKLVNSVTGTAIGSSSIIIVINSFDENSFFASAYDSSGSRVTTDFSWKSKGIV